MYIRTCIYACVMQYLISKYVLSIRSYRYLKHLHIFKLFISNAFFSYSHVCICMYVCSYIATYVCMNVMVHTS